MNVDYAAIGRERVITLNQLRAIPDVVGLLRRFRSAYPETGEPVGIMWDLPVNDDPARDAPALLAGLRGDKGTLKWWEECGNIGYVPQGNTQQGDWITYFHRGEAAGHYAGEEIPAEYVYAAIGEFVATGKRPTIIQWINDEEIPDRQPKMPLEDDPVFQEWQKF